MWQETTRQERNRLLFEREIDPFLPKRVLDFHVHLFTPATLPDDTDYSCAGHPIRHYDLDDLSADLADAYPGRETAAVCFGMPNVAYHQAPNDAYVAEACDNRRFFALRLFDPHADTPADIRRDLASRRFLGLKPYLDYVRKSDVNQVEIREMLPDAVMDVVDELGALVMLHIPRRERLADPLNQRQIVEIGERWPRARIVLAHVGRAYFLKNIEGHLDRLVGLPNLYFDLAMVGHWEVLAYLFERASADRVLFASDAPIAMAPGKSVEINDQYTYVTPVPWELSISDDHGKLVFTSFLYEEIRAIRKAVETLGLSRPFVEGLFWNNGMGLLESVKKPS